MSITRFLNEKELIPDENIVVDISKDGTSTLIIKNATPDMQGQIRAVASNVGGEELATADLEVRGLAPTFVETPLKCTILEGRVACFRKCCCLFYLQIYFKDLLQLFHSCVSLDKFENIEISSSVCI